MMQIKRNYLQPVYCGLFLLALLQLNACSTSRHGFYAGDGPPLHDVDVSRIPDATPKLEPLSKYGNPPSYMALGKRYYPLHSAAGYSEVGFASWYGTKFHKQLTSSHEPYDMLAMTGASKVLPIPCYVEVHNLENGRTVVVKVNDRGPFKANRIIDLSYAAAKKLGFNNRGTALVRVTAIDPRTWGKTLPKIAANSQEGATKIYLQVGAFGDKNNAQQLQNRIRNLVAAPVYINSGHGNDKMLYRVQVGPLTPAASQQVRAQLEERGLNIMKVIG